MPSQSDGRRTTPEEAARGLAGGVILGLPLVYTQEVWTHGGSIHPVAILTLLAGSFGINLVMSRYVGFEEGEGTPVQDALVGIGLSALLSAGLLFLLKRVDLSMSFENILGVIALTSVPTSLGFALGNALAPRDGGQGSEKFSGGAGDLLAAAGGALVLSMNIAPTEEPLLIASQLDIFRLLLLMAVSMVLSYVIVFFAEFRGKTKRVKSPGPFNRPVTETALAYIVAFVVSAVLLMSFGQLRASGLQVLPPIVVLSFPAAMGAALGRVIV